MFWSSHRFGLFDYFRVPYEFDRDPDREGDGAIGVMWPTETTSVDADGRFLAWWRGGHPDTPDVRAADRFQLGGCRVAGHLTPRPPDELLDGDDDWQPIVPILDTRDQQIAAVWRAGNGSVFLPFDPGEVMQFLWSESYLTIGHGRLRARARGAMLRTYYLLRPALPRRVQLLLRRRYASGQRRPDYPAWPLETGLHDLYTWVFELLADLAERPVAMIDVWPNGKSWAFVLTHDVETADGVSAIDLLRGPERELGYRSSWNFVPERYPLDDAVRQRLTDEGCEIGVHGLRHDGRDLASRRTLSRRLPAIRAAAERWGAVGFRSPATQRSWRLMPLLGFDYDSSYTDTEPYEPQPGGCCTYLPFHLDDLVELPITLPQDHTVFRVLDDVAPDIWVTKAHMLRTRDGMVLVLAHPDYADEQMQAAWRALLTEFAHDPTMWQVPAADVSDWWRRRAASRLVADEDGWRVDGPAADDGAVRLVSPATSGQRATT